MASEVSSLRSRFSSEAMSGLASRLQWEQYQKAAAVAAMQYTPLSMHHRSGGFSPTNFPGIEPIIVWSAYVLQ